MSVASQPTSQRRRVRYDGPADTIIVDGVEYRQGDVLNMDTAVVMHMASERAGRHRFSLPSDDSDAAGQLLATPAVSAHESLPDPAGTVTASTDEAPVDGASDQGKEERGAKTTKPKK